MILVISSVDDLSTDCFMEWSYYFKLEVLRLNEKAAFNVTKLIAWKNNELEIEFEINGEIIKLSQIEGVWFRRGHVAHFSKLEFDQVFAQRELSTITDFLTNESKTLNDFIVHALLQKRSLSDQNDYNANKLQVLLEATKVGLNIPDTIVTKEPAQLAANFNEKPLITKSLQDALTIKIGDSLFSARVHPLVDAGQIEWKRFHYSKFQHRIDKKYELRIFFINNDYYAGAIFSNEHEDLLVNRIVPFLLPKEILDKLKALNKQLSYNSGSIDMLVDKENKYYFLEINPVGQYDYLSKHCNYYLDLKFVDYFKN